MAANLLHQMLEDQAKARPHDAALVFRGNKISYEDLQDRVLKWASVLYQRGVKAGDTYGIVMRNSPEFVITFFALVRLGTRAVPVNFLLKADEIAYIFADAGVVGVITQPPFLGGVLEARKQLPALRDVVVTGDRREDVLSFNQLLENAPPITSLPQCGQPDEPAMIIYTSGTTGKPKGAMLTHRNFIANVQQCLGMVKLDHNDTFLCLLPMFHSFAWTVCVLLPLSIGTSTVIVESIQPFGEVIKQIFRHRVHAFVAVPPIYAALLRVPFWRPLRFLNPLRICISGAAALPTAVHQNFEEKFGVPLMEGYGLTEASPVVCLNPQDRRVPGSIGKALPGIELRFVDEAGKDVPKGEVGEICIKGDNVMKGYFHHEEATREAFLDDAHQWLKSGDLGHIDNDGYVFISDRKKDLIIVKGLNVYPKEVEDILLSHAAVQDAAVIGVQDETGDELIRAFVTLKPEATVDRQELLKLCRGQLAPYKCPRDLEIRKELPKNTLGKILKRTLRDEAVAKKNPGA
jgi:long-chain acyl-CoA synthetase